VASNAGSAPDSFYQRVYREVGRIPAGKVATYGGIARLAGRPGHARQVGYALHALRPGRVVPWHRVVNHRGEVSARRQPGPDLEQRLRLEEEGVAFGLRGRIDLSRYGWPSGAGGRKRPARRKR